MEITDSENLTLHFEILPRQTKKALDFFATQQWLSDTSWYLAGGTALALQAGNRKSVDLDFFTTKDHTDSVKVLNYLKKSKNWKTDINKENTIYGKLFKAKVSFIAYPFFVPQKKYLKCGTVNILDPQDIAVMKIIAISQRGKKRDFFDLYWCAQNVEPLSETIQRLPKQYPSVAHDYHHILKSLVFFEDAESDPDPEIYFRASWASVKRFFKKEVPEIARKLMKLK